MAIYNIATFEGASIFRALSPHYIVIWFQNNGTVGWQKLAGVFLCLTGCEAMFADLGHFTRRAVWVSHCYAHTSRLFVSSGGAGMKLPNDDTFRLHCPGCADHQRPVALSHAHTINPTLCQVSFTAVVYPSLALTYLGQASWLMHNLDGYSAVYYNSIPTPVFWPIFIVSVLASIVASQVSYLRKADFLAHMRKPFASC